jgi:pyrimidine operon attenuation protein/uracil phosphoribosyltransferase
LTRKKALSAEDIRRAVRGLAELISKNVKEPKTQWALVGIQRRGAPLARRLAQALQDLGAPALPVGALDITFYRDDMGTAPTDPVVHETELPFDVTGKTLLLVDDVLYSGRTVRCALDEIMDFGRPARVYLVCLVDRGHRELPIQADFVGRVLPTQRDERVDVHLEEVDGEDAVWLSPEAQLTGARRP